MIPFLQARHFKPANRAAVDLIVIHSAEVGETSETAEILMRRCAEERLDAHGKEIISSWHFAVDSNSVTQSVREKDIAWHAPGVNPISIGIELAGRAKQTGEQWNDEFSRSMLGLAAALTARLCREWNIPGTFVDAAGLLRRERGLTTHAEVTKAFHRSTHTDPGPNWPRESFMRQVLEDLDLGAQFTV